MRAIIDTNVIIDVLQKREQWFETGGKIFIAAANQRFTGCITAKQTADIHFFSRKQFKGQDNADEKARQVLYGLLSLFEVIDTLAADCRDAMGIGNNDYEDALMIASAQRAGVDSIVTRDPKHYRSSTVNVYSPEKFLDVLSDQ